MKKITTVYLLIIILCSVSSAMAASFSADIVMEKNGKTETGKFYLLNRYYRLEILENGKPMVIIADTEKNVHYVLNMEEKVFFEVSSDDFGILSEDPFKASEYMVSKYGSKVEGTEKINGIDCDKQAVIVQDTKIHSRWFSNELEFSVKLVSYEGKQASYVTELKAIKNMDLAMDLFTPPDDFKQVEEPGAAEKRKREVESEKETAFPGLTTTESVQRPCYVKIAVGGELHIPIDTDREAYLEIKNEADGESVYTVLEYQNGKPREGYEATPWKLERKGYHKNWEFNDEFWQNTPSRLVDEVRIKVDKGMVYANLSQTGADRKDFYNRGNLQNGAIVDSKRSLAMRITGDNPFGDQTSGKFWIEYEAGGTSEAISFTVETGKTKTWDYPADKGVKAVSVLISQGDGRAKISLIQPPVLQKAAAEQPAVKKMPTPTPTYAPKAVTQFTVTHPAGTGKPLTPGKDLTITVTGVSADASGEIFLHTDRKKTEQVDAFKFKLKKDQAESFAVSGEKNAGWATVWVYKGSFTVKLDQSPDAEATQTPETNKDTAASNGADKPIASSGTILNGEVPLYKGARVIKTRDSGAYRMAELQVDATPQEIVDFYKQAMSASGWEAAVGMAQGNKGMLMLKQSSRQLVFKVEGQGDSSTVVVTILGQ